MKIPVIKIGNSKGIRLSKTLLKRYELDDEVELILQEEQIVIRASKKARSSWEDQFKSDLAGSDGLLIDDVFEDENFDEWK